MRNIAAIIIPGRLASVRYPRKLLEKFEDKPLLQHAFEGASKSRNAFVTFLALEEEELVEDARKFAPPTQVYKVSGDFKNGSERAAYASRLPILGKADIIVIVQGDELLVDPDLIDALISEVSTFETDIATAYIKRDAANGGKDPSKVKMSIENGFVSDINRDNVEEGEFFEHIGITAFRKAALWDIASKLPSKNERLHNNEYWRALDNGYKIKAVETKKEVLNVNTTEDHLRATQYFEALKSPPAPSKPKSSRKDGPKRKAPAKRRRKRTSSKAE